MMKRFPNHVPKQYRNDEPPTRKKAYPRAKTLDAAMSRIAKFQTFDAPHLVWEDRNHDGKVISKTVYAVTGFNHSPGGIRKCYAVTDSGTRRHSTTGDYLTPCLGFPALLFLYDFKTGQWYRNASPWAETEDHPLYPCTPPDKPVIPLPDSQIRYLLDHTIMDLMEAKLNGRFKSFRMYTDSQGRKIVDFDTWEEDASDWFEKFTK